MRVVALSPSSSISLSFLHSQKPLLPLSALRFITAEPIAHPRRPWFGFTEWRSASYSSTWLTLTEVSLVNNKKKKKPVGIWGEETRTRSWRKPEELVPCWQCFGEWAEGEVCWWRVTYLTWSHFSVSHVLIFGDWLLPPSLTHRMELLKTSYWTSNPLSNHDRSCEKHMSNREVLKPFYFSKTVSKFSLIALQHFHVYLINTLQHFAPPQQYSWAKRQPLKFWPGRNGRTPFGKKSNKATWSGSAWRSAAVLKRPARSSKTKLKLYEPSAINLHKYNTSLPGLKKNNWIPLENIAL